MDLSPSINEPNDGKTVDEHFCCHNLFPVRSRTIVPRCLCKVVKRKKVEKIQMNNRIHFDSVLKFEELYSNCTTYVSGGSCFPFSLRHLI